jgi:hypothetical protein
MMRPFHVGPIPPPSGGKKGAAVDNPEPVRDLQASFRFYPNPVSSQANLEFVLESESGVNVRVYRLDGSLVKSEDLGILSEGFHTHALTTDQMDNGMYILELNTGNSQFRETVVVSK